MGNQNNPTHSESAAKMEAKLKEVAEAQKKVHFHFLMRNMWTFSHPMLCRRLLEKQQLKRRRPNLKKKERKGYVSDRQSFLLAQY
jgi:hypothetical protein